MDIAHTTAQSALASFTSDFAASLSASASASASSIASSSAPSLSMLAIAPDREFHCMTPCNATGETPLRALLLEGISASALAVFNSFPSGAIACDRVSTALSEDELVSRIPDYHLLCIRSKSCVTARVLRAARRLLAVGCFCIGTNQVDVAAASQRGICVFNSPHANSRSVAELTIANIICLARQLGDRNREMHAGNWRKVSTACHEIRGKSLAIIGYGHVGSQVSVLAEALGMRVMYYDIAQPMPLGGARRLDSLEAALKAADFVTLHVPETPETRSLLCREKLRLLKQGSYLINASRGPVVDVDALAELLRSKHLAGAAIDVFPDEPAANGTGNFASPLRDCPNTLLSPHIGGSTEEAQSAIGAEVASALTNYVLHGTTISSVNLPPMSLRPRRAAATAAPSPSSASPTNAAVGGAPQPPSPLLVRVSNVHRNVPGVLKEINRLLSPFNIEAQCSESMGEIAYFLADVSFQESSAKTELAEIYNGMSSLEANILTRFFY